MAFQPFRKHKTPGYRPPETPPAEKQPLGHSLDENLIAIRAASENTQDLVIREFNVSGISAALVLCEGMFNLTTLGQNVLVPLAGLKLKEPDPQQLLEQVRHNLLLAVDQSEIYTIGEVYSFIISGFLIIIRFPK